MNETPSDAELTAEVVSALARAGLPASDDEIAKLVVGHHMQRLGIEMLYAIPEARYVDSGLRFQAGARIVDWSD